MPKLEQVNFWVWLDPSMEGRPPRWCYRSARIPWTNGTDSNVMGLNCQTREAAMSKARYEIRQYGYGAKLVPVPQDFAVAQGLLKGTE